MQIHPHRHHDSRGCQGSLHVRWRCSLLDSRVQHGYGIMIHVHNDRRSIRRIRSHLLVSWCWGAWIYSGWSASISEIVHRMSNFNPLSAPHSTINTRALFAFSPSPPSPRVPDPDFPPSQKWIAHVVNACLNASTWQQYPSSQPNNPHFPQHAARPPTTPSSKPSTQLALTAE
jgi:hypothetical protein